MKTLTVRNLIKKTELNLDDIKDYLADLGNYENTIRVMREFTEFDYPIVDICTIEKYSDENVLSSEIIEDPSI